MFYKTIFPAKIMFHVKNISTGKSRICCYAYINQLKKLKKNSPELFIQPFCLSNFAAFTCRWNDNHAMSLAFLIRML